MSQDISPLAATDPALAAPSAPPTFASAPGAKPPKSFLAHAKLIGALTLLSRLLGLVREIVWGHFFGTGDVSNAFVFAFSVPNLFRKLFGEGALSAAFIPLYAQAVKHHHRDQANDFASASVNMLCVMLLIITVIGELAIGATIFFFGHHMLADRLLTLKFTAIMLPYVLLICGTAFLSSILQVHRRFGAPAFAPVLLNVCHVVVILLGAQILHLKTGPATAMMRSQQTTLAYWLCLAVLVAGVMQVMILWPSLAAVGFRLQWVRNFWTPQVRRMLRLSIPVAMGAGVLQLSVLMDKGISLLLSRGSLPGQDVFHLFGHIVRYPMQNGAVERLNIAQYLYQFPLGIFAIALATAIFPDLSADALEKDSGRFCGALLQGIEATLFEGLAASIGLIAVRYPAIKLLFQHGDMKPADTELIARSLVFYASAIWAFSMLQIINRAFYALHDTRTPLYMSIVNILLNLVVELPLVWLKPLGEAGMAAGTCVSFAVQAIIMLKILDRRINGLGIRRIMPDVLKMVIAAAAMGIACFGVQYLPIYHAHDNRRIVWAIQLGGLMILGACVYLGLCRAMGLKVLDQLLPARLRMKRSPG